MRILQFLVPALLATVFGARAEETWPGWRGPRGDRTSADQEVPLKWDVEKDVVWIIPIPGKGHASPIVWKDEIFVRGSEGRIGEAEEGGAEVAVGGKASAQQLRVEHPGNGWRASLRELSRSRPDVCGGI
jgi:hypothetical protein